MTLTTRRQFVEQTALAEAGLYGCRIEALAGAPWTFEACEQSATQLDAAAIRTLASKITGRIITPEASDYESSRLVFNRAFEVEHFCDTAPKHVDSVSRCENRELSIEKDETQQVA